MLSQSDLKTQKLPTLLGVNILYVLTLILVVTVGAVMQLVSTMLGLIGTELVVILLPAMVFLWVTRLPVRETLRLRMPNVRLIVLSLVIGAGLWLAAVWLDTVVSALLGYSVGTPPDFYPTTPVEAIIVFAALAIFAPICEETLFRGVIQRGYERLGPWVGIIFGGLLFAFYHMRFQGLIAILPISIVLGYVVWRSNSLVTGILVHFANNALSAIMVILSTLYPDVVLAFPTMPVALIGAVIALAGLLLFHRSTTPVAVSVAPEQTRVACLLGGLPLFIVMVIYIVLAGLEILLFGFPQVVAVQQMVLPTAPWQNAVRWEYQIRNVIDEPIGNARCQLTPAQGKTTLSCQMQHKAFEAQQGNSYFKFGQYTQQQDTTWRSDNLHLLEAKLTQQNDDRTFKMTVTPNEKGLQMTVVQPDRSNENLALPADTLLIDEWPWRLTTLPFSFGYVCRATVALPMRWRPDTRTSGPTTQNTYVLVQGAEPVWTPAGNFIAWHVKVGNTETAWYDTKAPHTLLRYDNGTVRYLLTKID